MPEFSLSENASGPLPTRLSDGFNAKLYPLNYAKTLLFKAVSQTLLEFGQTRLKATLGIIAVLHTWDQTLKDHFHLHCLVPAGALSFDQNRWISARPNFLFSVTALSH